MKIPCTLKNTGRINSIWNQSLDGLAGNIVHVVNSVWGGYQVKVQVDNPPDWIKGKKNNDIVNCVYVDKIIGRDLIAKITDEDHEKLRLWAMGIVKCESCGKILPEHAEDCFVLRQVNSDNDLFAEVK